MTSLRVCDMNLTGQTFVIEIRRDFNDLDFKHRLETLGIYPGAKVCIESDNDTNLIVKCNDTRIGVCKAQILPMLKLSESSE